MRVFNRDQRARLLGAVTSRYLSSAEPGDISLGAPAPASCGKGAWYPVSLFVRYDDAGISSVEDIARRFVQDWDGRAISESTAQHTMACLVDDLREALGDAGSG